MEAPSTRGHRGRVPWQGLLLAVSLSTFWIPPVTAAKPTVESEPLYVAEGQDVLLLVHNLQMYIGVFSWYKGGEANSSQRIISYRVDTEDTIIGPAHSGRETLYRNISLRIQNVTQNDTGLYTLEYSPNGTVKDYVTGQLRVYPVLHKPHIISNNSNPVEDKDTVELTCEPETQDTTYLWSINSQSLPDSPRLQLSKDNRTLTILCVTRKDTGPYVCEIKSPVGARHSDPLTLNVLYGPDTPTISSLDSHYRPGEVLILSCHAASNPPARYSWLINGTSQQYTQELVVPNVTESDSGSYTCLAHNSATGFFKTTVKIITVSESVVKPSIQASNTTVTERKDQVVLTCLTRDTDISILWLLNNQRLQLTDRRKLSWDNRTLTINPVRREDAGDYQCEVANPVSSSKSDPITLTVTGGRDTTGFSAGAIAGIVIGVLAGVALAATLGCVLIRRRSGRTSGKHGHPEHLPSASTPGRAPSGRSTPSDPPPDTKPDVPIYEELLHSNRDIYCYINHVKEEEPYASSIQLPLGPVSKVHGEVPTNSPDSGTSHARR